MTAKTSRPKKAASFFFMDDFSNVIYWAGLVTYQLCLGGNCWLIIPLWQRWKGKYPCFLAFLIFTTLRWLVNFAPIWTGNLQLYNTLYWWGRPLYVFFAVLVLAEVSGRKTLWLAGLACEGFEALLLCLSTRQAAMMLYSLDRVYASIIAAAFILLAIWGKDKPTRVIASGFAIATVFEVAVQVVSVAQYGHALRMVPVFSYAVGLGIWLRYFSKERER